MKDDFDSLGKELLEMINGTWNEEKNNKLICTSNLNSTHPTIFHLTGIKIDGRYKFEAMQNSLGVIEKYN